MDPRLSQKEYERLFREYGEHCQKQETIKTLKTADRILDMGIATLTDYYGKVVPEYQNPRYGSSITSWWPHSSWVEESAKKIYQHGINVPPRQWKKD